MSDWEDEHLPESTRVKARSKKVHDGKVMAYVSMDGPRRRYHLSVSHLAGDGHALREPTREELFEARREFVPEGVFMAMLVPPLEAKLTGPFHSLHLMEVDPDPYWMTEGA
jgi:hypothetical protein